MGMPEMLAELPESLEERVSLLSDITVGDISSRYRLNGVLGSGAQATVYAGLARKTQRKVAVKVLDSKELEDEELFDALRLEIMILKQLRHPYIVNLQEVVRDSEKIYIVQECLGGGELFEQLLAKGPFKEDYALAIFAQVSIAVDYLHGLDVAHRDLKAENLVFAAKGSPIIKFIDFGGAAMWTQEQGLVGLVGTPQYVAPEVVTGYGDDNPTHKPYGKGCDLWSMGVLLYVMLSKTMPFRAKEVGVLLKQVVKAKFSFRPEERWKNVSAEAKDLITNLLHKDPTKRLTIKQVNEHPWTADAIKRCAENLPKMEEVPKDKGGKSNEAGGWGSVFKPAFDRLGSRLGGITTEKIKIQGRPNKDKGAMSREQQYWYAMEISPPSETKKEGGITLGPDGKFQMDNVPPEMRKMLEEIERSKAQRETAAAPSSVAGSSNVPTIKLGAAAPPPPPGSRPAGRSAASSGGPPPPPGGGGAPPPPPGPPPPDSHYEVNYGGESETAAQMQRLQTENEAALATRDSQTMDTLLLMTAKDAEIEELKQALSEEQARNAALQAGSGAAVPPPPPANMELDEAREQARAAVERAEKAEGKLLETNQALTKLTAKLNAVSTLYTEAAQREAVLRIQLEQAGAAATPSYE